MLYVVIAINLVIFLSIGIFIGVYYCVKQKWVWDEDKEVVKENVYSCCKEPSEAPKIMTNGPIRFVPIDFEKGEKAILARFFQVSADFDGASIGTENGELHEFKNRIWTKDRGEENPLARRLVFKDAWKLKDLKSGDVKKQAP